MYKEQEENYRNLISGVLTYPHRAESILEINQQLLDSSLMQMIEQVAISMAANNSTEAASFLRSLLVQLRADYSTNKESKSSKPFPKLILMAIAITLAVGGVKAYLPWQSQQSQSNVTQTAENTIPKIKTVTAMGRLEPKGEIIQLSASTLTEGNRVEQLLVQEGDWVKVNQVIATLDSRTRLQSLLEEAREKVRVAQANVDQVKAGAKAGAIEAQQAAIARIGVESHENIKAQVARVARLEAGLRNALVEDRRYQMLYREGAISASERDSKHLDYNSDLRLLQEAKADLERTRLAQQQLLNEAKAKLKQIAEVRPVDVEVAKAEVRAAQAALTTAKAQLDLAYIKAPQAGRVLDILTRPGEMVSSDGIVRIGQTKQMYAVAEIYESDIGKVQVGQKVKITSNAISSELHGTVERIGLEVQQQKVINTDPAANIDAKVVEVKVKLDEKSSQKVEGLTNLLIKLVISL